MRIGEILAAKQHQDVLTVDPDAGVRALLGMLAEHNVGALVVSRDGREMLGIVSERDVVRHLHHDGTVVNNHVGAIMTGAVHTCTPDDEMDDVLGQMTHQRVRHVPVLDEGTLVGIVSIGDLVKHKIDALQFERDALDSYVNQG
ncbi:CBS domain-containing protein [Nocardioides bruguierae]|uniref:CBS domain-containing protein n=1 Tax=Nocardioides bruguierae TaxID=2945102 RepID=A0A9X2D6R0_9ACTN|nr:CBS domain-containing protein [Nocardioides bruguierae]MCL8024839.1 CBS domain-containing protein [Nocardioides bruguierae]MCM0619244.1 CBS domain-containing protein [Nocardioides bruguierae]